MPRTHRALSDLQAQSRLAELLDLGGYPDRLYVADAPRGADPRWVHLLRPDGGQRRIARATITALERRGLLQHAQRGLMRVYTVCPGARVPHTVDTHARLAEVMDRCGYPDRIVVSTRLSPTADPRWLRAIRPDGELCGIHYETLRMLVRRGLLSVGEAEEDRITYWLTHGPTSAATSSANPRSATSSIQHPGSGSAA